ncbi:MAG: sulfotransferase [Rudaea sp.]
MATSVTTNPAWLEEFRATAARTSADAARQALAENLRVADADAATWQDIATRLLAAGFAESATSLLDAALGKFPQAVELHYWHGNALRLSGNPHAAERELRHVLAIEPAHRDASLSLAYMLRERGQFDAAASAIASAWHARGEAASEACVADLIFLRECGAHARAFGLARSALQRHPDNAQLAALTGEFALATGAFETARGYLRQALERNPMDGASWLRLAYCQRFDAADGADARRIREAWQDASPDADARIPIGFAHGKVLDDIGDYAEAARVLRWANARAAARSGWNPGHWRRFVDTAIAAPAIPAAHGSYATADFNPVFVIGLPRTGTTLIAELLARHAQVRVRGELHWIGHMRAQLAERNRLGDRAALATVAGLVAEQMRRDDAPARYYIDKNPLNFRDLDFIAALFPRARIIHCRRGMRDTALSLWLQHFAHADLDFSYDFAHIAEFARGHERLMAHWRRHLALPMFELDYELLATDPAGELARVAEFLGLGSEGDATTEESGVITTASVWQARQPVYLTSIDRWKRYAPYLTELQTLF